MKPLAHWRGRLHFVCMTKVLLITGFFALLAAPAFAQETVPAPVPEFPREEIPETAPEDAPEDAPEILPQIAPETPEENKDLTIRSEQDRAEKLLELFENLKDAPDEEAGKLVAEEVWAVFLQSGSASVDFALLRGISAENRNDLKLARRMYDHVMRLQPAYAEGWSRSGNLAIKEDNLNRAVSDITQALVYEPRHFYALWTLGTILERVGKTEAAFEIYEEAFKLYPEHKDIKARVESLRESVKGKAL